MLAISKSIAKGMVASASALLCLAAAPALATTTTTTTTAAVDVKAPTEDAASPLGEGDQQFEELFAKWEDLDRDTDADAGTKAPKVSVSIPSRMPLAGAKMTSGYGMRNHPVLRKRARHKGVDLAAPTGTPVYATADGLVQKAEWFSSYGKFIKIGHGNKLETRYAHLSGIAVTAGESVKKGDLIGYVGSTGRSTGPHLHYEVRIAGVAVNPIPYMVESEAQLAFARATGREVAVGGE